MFGLGLCLVICALALGGCGSSGSGAGSGSASRLRADAYGPPDSPAAMSRCMRANGLSTFPDPQQGSGGVGFPGGVDSSGPGTLTVDGITYAGPAFQTAARACARYLAPSGPIVIPASQRARMLAMAKCMRANGVPSFADPTFTVSPRTATGRRSLASLPPAFQHAASVCNHGR
jgi:hypothetical protein